jgi:predicted secreted protein
MLALLVLCGAGVALAAEKAAPITTEVGEEFTIKLESKLTEGCQWLLDKPTDPRMLKYVRVEFKRTPTKTAGMKGVEILTFKAVGQGTAEVCLKYDRLMDKNSVSNEKTNFLVRVVAQGTKKK